MRSEAETIKEVESLLMIEGQKISPEIAYQRLSEVLGDEDLFKDTLQFLLCLAMFEFQAQQMQKVPVESMTRSAALSARSLAINYYARMDVINDLQEKQSNGEQHGSE